MSALTLPTAIAGGILLFGFFGIVLYKMVTGEISLAGLIRTKDPSDNSSYSPARLQALIFTVVVAANYLHSVIANPQRDTLPGLPQSVVAALGGSHALYLVAKAFSAFVPPVTKNSR